MKISKNVFKFIFKIILILLYFKHFNGVGSQCNNVGDWMCDNGQCINEDELCDGKVDCVDRSDEIAENCMQFHESCQEFAFRCAYGACIDGKAKCNGVQDCADNSDELICIKKDDSDFQGSCSDTEMQCLTSKECINSINICDGRADCKDGSDESLEVCINYGCVSFGFQCGYGACINTNAKCNGTKECADGSDEAWELCRTPRKPSSATVIKPTPTPTPIPTPRPTPTPTPTPNTGEFSNCFIPNTPDLQNMIFKHHPLNNTIQLGSSVKSYDIVHIECKSKYILRGKSSLLCLNGDWNLDFPTCLAYCDGNLLRGISIRAVCNYRKRSVMCVKEIRPGTDIQINCLFGYTRTPDEDQIIKCLPDGTFDKKPLSCDRSCGRVAPALVPLSRHGVPIQPSMAPWHVSIHEFDQVEYVYLCSGSIVSPSVILTAAHCFWDIATRQLRTYTGYKIIAGRNSSNFITVQEEFAQTVDVEDIQIPKNYRGPNYRHKYDIAFLKLKTALRYSETIASICIPNDLGSFSADVYIPSNKAGYITGYGATRFLERLNMITLSYHDCLAKSPKDTPVAEDKFCIFNRENSLVCRGDSGSGYFVETKNYDAKEIIYRLLGVVSNTPTTKNDCIHVGDDAFVAITYIYYITPEFEKKLLMAMKDDERLF